MNRYILLLVCVLGCDLFPEDLLTDAAVDGSVVMLGESCVGEVPTLPSGTTAVFDLTGYRDDVSAVAGCTGLATPGADGFFAVVMEANEKWHFHVRNTAASGLDPAIYVLDSACDARRCGPTDGIDRCGGDRDEHLTFVAPRAGSFFVGLDSTGAGDGTYELLVVRPTCGNGDVEHSETCDDENTISGDGCDETCRVELGASRTSEEEPNDDFTGANLVPAGGLDVDGQLSSECDVDLFAIDVPASGAVSVEVLQAGGAACVDPAPTFDLRVWNSDATVVRATGAIEAGNACPVLNATGLAPGPHLVSIATNDERPVTYVLRITYP